MEILLSTIVLGAWCGYASSLLGSRVSNKGVQAAKIIAVTTSLLSIVVLLVIDFYK